MVTPVVLDVEVAVKRLGQRDFRQPAFQFVLLVAHFVCGVDTHPPSMPTDNARPILAGQLRPPSNPSQLRFEAVNKYAPKMTLAYWNGM